MSEATKAADAATWDLIHQERASIANTLADLDDDQWVRPSACGSWTVRQTAAHIVLGAEQTGPHFMARMAANGFRFNTMIDHEAREGAEAPPVDLVARLRARLNTVNRPPAPVRDDVG